jgi:hypothetical protein
MWGRRIKVMPRKPMRDNSRNLSVRMTAMEYQQLQRYLKLTRLSSTTYLRHLIHGNGVKARSGELNHALHASLGKIHSNMHQIIRCRRTRELEATARARYLMDRLCEEVHLLTGQK